MTSSDLHQTSSNLVQKCVLARTQPTAPESRMLTFPCLCGAVPQSSLRCCLLGYSPHFTANKLNSHCALFLFFLMCPSLCDPVDCSPPGSSVREARILEWVAMPFSRGSSPPRDRTCVSYVSCIASRFFTHWAIREATEDVKKIISIAYFQNI